jgi:hypothetical protein
MDGGGARPIADGAIVSPVVDAGAADAPISNDAPIRTCSSSVSDPCEAGMPRFSGYQDLDGKNDDMCSLPAFQFTAQDAAKLLNFNNVPPSQFEVATLRVGWAPDAFHVFVDVADKSVQTVQMVDPAQAIAKVYQGDSIELFISASNNLTGLTGKDANALHVIIPASGPAVSVKTDDSSGGSSGRHSELPTAQYKQALTPSGYVIEAMLPWPGGVAPSAGTTVRFDVGLNSADKTFGAVDDMRDGQMLFYVGSVTGNTTCQGSDGTVPYCDDRTWCPAQLQ